MLCQILSDKILRLGQFIFAVVVTGINGAYLSQSTASNWDNARFIYVEVLAGLSIIAAWGRLRLNPNHIWTLWFFDAFVVVEWVVGFGLITNTLVNSPCGYAFDWDISSECDKMKATAVFSFICFLSWLASAALSFFELVRLFRKELRYQQWGANRGNNAV